MPVQPEILFLETKSAAGFSMPGPRRGHGVVTGSKAGINPVPSSGVPGALAARGPSGSQVPPGFLRA
jgi:hypothetical protein